MHSVAQYRTCRHTEYPLVLTALLKQAINTGQLCSPQYSYVLYMPNAKVSVSVNDVLCPLEREEWNLQPITDLQLTFTFLSAITTVFSLP